MTEGETIRTINGVRCRCQDVGCPDFERARRNRERIANKQSVSAYLAIEGALRATPRGRALPAWIPLGDLPVVSKEDWRESSGDGFVVEGQDETTTTDGDLEDLEALEEIDSDKGDDNG